MATVRVGSSIGGAVQSVAVAAGSAVAADTVELTFDLAASGSKQDILQALERIKAKIEHSPVFPPANT